MGRRRDSPNRPVRLDRFETHRTFIKNVLPHLVKGDQGSMAAAIVWFVLWDWASGKDGTIRGASATRLASTTGISRKTVGIAMKRLKDAKAISVKSEGVVPVYVMLHKTQDRGEPES